MDPEIDKFTASLVQIIAPDSKDVYVLNIDEAISDEQFSKKQKIIEEFISERAPHASIIFLTGRFTINVLNEADMNRHGWYRQD